MEQIANLTIATVKANRESMISLPLLAFLSDVQFFSFVAFFKGCRARDPPECRHAYKFAMKARLCADISRNITYVRRPMRFTV